MQHKPLQMSPGQAASADLFEEWLSVLPAAGDEAGLNLPDLEALTGAPEVREAGATVALRYGLDALGLPRTGLLVRHPDAETVSRTCDALLLEGRRLGLQVALV
jgi:hypothetical protein